MTNKEAISNLNHIYGIVSSDIQRSLDLAIKALEERPQGEWVFRNGVTCVGYYKYSKCGEVERAEKNFCPNCGARMKGGKE